MRSIGGDFEVAPEAFSGDDDPDARALLPSCGRAALYHILIEIGASSRKAALLVPDYTCSTVPDAAVAAGVDVIPYPVGPDLRADRTALKPLLRDDRCHLLLTNYFGVVPVDEDVGWVRTLSPTTVIIEDDSQAPFCLDESLADYAFTSFRKAFAVPDGADIRPRLHRTFNPQRIEPFVLAWSAGALIKHAAQAVAIPDDVYLRFFEASKHEIDDRVNLDAAISAVAWNAMRNSMSEVAEPRRRNFQDLSRLLEPIGISSIVQPERDRVPLFLPILIQNRDEIRQRLAEKHIYCPTHWPELWAGERSGAMSRELHDHGLSLVIDQRYGVDDMKRIAQELEMAGVEAFAAA